MFKREILGAQYDFKIVMEIATKETHLNQRHMTKPKKHPTPEKKKKIYIKNAYQTDRLTSSDETSLICKD